MNDVLFDHRQKTGIKRELVGLRLETWKFKSVVESTFALHRSSGLLALNFLLLDHSVHDLERFRTLSLMKARACERFDVLGEKSHRMTSQKLFTRTH